MKFRPVHRQLPWARSVLVLLPSELDPPAVRRPQSAVVSCAAMAGYSSKSLVPGRRVSWLRRSCRACASSWHRRTGNRSRQGRPRRLTCAQCRDEEAVKPPIFGEVDSLYEKACPPWSGHIACAEDDKVNGEAGRFTGSKLWRLVPGTFI